MNQSVKYIKIKDLVLWTENPRDPIDPNATDQDIINRALRDNNAKWTLAKLAKEMGQYYDFSELPTVVYHGSNPIVYDGNRRLVLGKIKLGFAAVEDRLEVDNIPYFPTEIPCNVCDEQTALNNVYRKHHDTGSWQPLERDIFLNKFMKKDKSTFLILDEKTNIISENPHLNKRFVKEEIFKNEMLKELGFTIKRDGLYSVHNDDEAYSILSDISQKIKDKIISTRRNRGKVMNVLKPESQSMISENVGKRQHLAKISFGTDNRPEKQVRLTRRRKKRTKEVFGGKLCLRYGEVSDLHRDIMDLHSFYLENKKNLSQSFPGLIRMSLRLLCETAARDLSQMKLDK